uniref:Pepsin inhibitor-3-like repeated domain-containing protein n=1 Tax=Globodera rostochiensis TaxID=31243 RepID=A0A914I4G1_GLORO
MLFQSSFFVFIISALLFPIGAVDVQLATRGCQYSVNDGIISDGEGHSRRMTPDEEQQLANYHAAVARATEEFQSQMMRAVAAPFKEFGQNIGQTPQLRLPEAPCFRVNGQTDQSYGGGGGGGDDEAASDD